ncbi:MAG: glycine--tRNA ligase subunit beta [Candidatus Krumholzibacteria bacterium]|nr:glycine--tRNA ligase subunit beta [Candidatus Krumholzibacteria bacterium]
MSQLDNQTPATDSLPFLLEIGSEEIPARFIGEAMAELRRLSEEALAAAHLSAEGIRVVATPRRMALLIDRMSVRQPDREVEIKGPPVSVAFDTDGNPTRAGEGFARKAGIDLASCNRGSDKRGEFLLARKTETGLPASDVLAEIMPRVIMSVPFRKVMRWGNHDLEYPRPLQWLVALLGDQVVPLRVDYLAAGRTSRGHRTLAQDRPVEIPEPGRYLDIMREVGIIADQAERVELIRTGHARELEAYDPNALLIEDEDLLTEVAFLCEFPTPFLGSYNEDYFALPSEVITTALKAHQRYFSIGSASAPGLLPRFAAVRDGGADHLENVVRGNERVLNARLADALFYWDFDQKKSPDEFRSMLGNVTWLEGFGSVGDKSGRLTGLAAWLWDNGMGDGKQAPTALVRAAEICKSDLVSEMIRDGKEFTKLEGFIGSCYAARAGESEEVCRAIERHYFPRSATGEVPVDRISSCLSVADRLDNVAGCWLAGFAPTGAKDPYALRRHVLAILRILLDLGARVDLEAALKEAMGPVAQFTDGQGVSVALEQIHDFVRTRMAGYFTDNLDCSPEAVRAVLPVRWSDPQDALAWTRALAGYRDREDFQLLATGFKRCRNILKGDVLAVDELDNCLERWLTGGRDRGGEGFGGLTEPAEIELRDQVTAAVPQLVKAEAAGDYARVFAVFSGLGPAIDAFFDTVRVNVEDEALRRVRHGFLREIHGLFVRYADFSQVAPLE